VADPELALSAVAEQLQFIQIELVPGQSWSITILSRSVQSRQIGGTMEEIHPFSG